MKKFNTIPALLVACLLIFQLDVAKSADRSLKEACTLLPNAPQQHTVVPGDSLWGIAQMFLNHPWCWPVVWGMNKKEISNPHWIYPGQVIYVDEATKQLRLGKPLRQQKNALSTVKLSPRVRSEATDQAITTIPAGMIEPFLSQPLVLEENALAMAPRVIAAPEGHVNMGAFEKVYVVGDLQDKKIFQVYRPATELLDPITKKNLGYEYFYVGELKLQKAATSPDEAHTFVVTQAKEELTVGDKLFPIPDKMVTNYVPHAPEKDVSGHIVSIYGGVAQAGQNQTVVVNVGKQSGMDVGAVLTLSRLGGTVLDKMTDKNIKLPNEAYGVLMLYRVFDKVSYGVIMNVTDAVRIGDMVSVAQ